MSEDESIVEGESLVSTVISRRNLIKAGAIVGGVVWAAPVIDSFASPASAGSSLSGCYVCFSPTGTAFFAGQDNPGPAEAISSCTAEATKIGAKFTSGTYVLFNTTDPKGYWGSVVPPGFIGAYCQYANGSHALAELNDSCPATWSGGGTPSSVTCATGSW